MVAFIPLEPNMPPVLLPFRDCSNAGPFSSAEDMSKLAMLDCVCRTDFQV